jgi:hypothetical protein
MPFSCGKPTLLASVLIVPSLMGCGNPVQRQLEGRWLGDSVESFEQRELSRATGWAKGVSFEFSGTKITVTIPAEEPRTAPYKVAAVHASDVRLAVQRPDGKVDPVHLKIDDERSLRWMLDGTRSVVFRRDE